MNDSIEVQPPAPLMTTEEAARFFNKSVGTLQNWRYLRTGPAFIKCGGSIRYRMVDLQNFVRRHRVDVEQ
jgi:hypothetical protein